MKAKIYVPLIVYGAIMVLGISFPGTITKVIPKDILFIIASISAIIVATFWVASWIKKVKSEDTK
jgi:hypothetical protein